MRSKRLFFLIIITLFILLAVSCEKDELIISSTMIEPYVIKDENRMGLCVYIVTEESKDNIKELQITSPDGSLTWTVDARATKFSGTLYNGSSDIVMPQNTSLPKGKWQLRVVSDDGRVCETTFNVFWTDIEGSLERTEDGYDEISNLTIM